MWSGFSSLSETRMNTEHRHIEISGIDVEVVRKDIKNLHIGVYPPAGRVRVAAPSRLSDDAVRMAVIDKLGWIRRQQARFIEQVRQSEREMVSGESHYFLGRRYRLEVVEHAGRASVRLGNSSRIELRIRPGTDAAKRREILNNWYRRELKQRIPGLIHEWEPVVGVEVADWGVKKMKTMWGSCNIHDRRIWLNLELAKKSPECLEYVLVHEMVHLLERCHNDRFKELMNKAMPQWRLYRDELNRGPLAHEHWKY